MKNTAPRGEIVAAIEALTTQEYLRLKLYARWRIRGLGRAAKGRDWEDLLREAISSTYEGNRNWNKEVVDFCRHLTSAMQSISSHWRDQFDPDEALLESEVTHISAEGIVSNPMLNVASSAADPERILAAKEEVEQIEQVASKNPLAWLILEGLRDQMTGPEIRAALAISQKEYETAFKWLRRNVRAKIRGEGNNG